MLDLTSAPAPSFPPSPAPFSRRLASSLIDGCTILLPALLITVFLSSLVEDINSKFILGDLLKMIFTFIGVSSVGVLISLPALLSRVNNGMTLGHVITKTRMVRLDGERIQISNIVGRWGFAGALPITLMFINSRLWIIVFLWFVIDAAWPMLSSIPPGIIPPGIGRRNLRDYLSGLQVVSAISSPLPGPGIPYGSYLRPLIKKPIDEAEQKANDPYQAPPPVKTPNGFYPVADGNYRLFFEGVWWSPEIQARPIAVNIALYLLWNLLVLFLSMPLFLIAPILSTIFLVREKLRGPPSSELTTEGIKPSANRSIIGPVLLAAIVVVLAGATLILFIKVIPDNPNLFKTNPVVEQANKEKFAARVKQIEQMAGPGSFLTGFGNELYGCPSLQAIRYYKKECGKLIDSEDISFSDWWGGSRNEAPRGTASQLEIEADNVWDDCRAYLFQSANGQLIKSRLDCPPT